MCRKLTYFSGDYWPGIAEQEIKKITSKERKSTTKKCLMHSLQVLPTVRSAGKKRTKMQQPRSQKMRIVLTVFISQAKGRANEKLRYNYVTNERRFYCYPVAPRCWACEKYILSQERFLCKRSRERGIEIHSLPGMLMLYRQKTKTVVGKEKLLNSVCTKVDKKPSWNGHQRNLNPLKRRTTKS